MVRLPRCIQLMALWPPLDHARASASTALGPCSRDAAPARARGGQPVRSSAHSHTNANRDRHRSGACANSCPCLSRRVQSTPVFSCNNRRKTGAVNATPGKSTRNRYGGRKGTGNNRSRNREITDTEGARGVAGPPFGRPLSLAPSRRKFGEYRILEDSRYMSQEDSTYMFASSQS